MTARARAGDRSARRPHPAGLLVVDAANVVGARPDGWWKDRAAAADRLLTAIAAGARASELRGRRIVVVLEGAAAGVRGDREGVELVRVERDGDQAVVDVVAAQGGSPVHVVTSDRGLRERVEARGARVSGAGWLWKVLDRAG